MLEKRPSTPNSSTAPTTFNGRIAQNHPRPSSKTHASVRTSGGTERVGCTHAPAPTLTGAAVPSFAGPGEPCSVEFWLPIRQPLLV